MDRRLAISRLALMMGGAVSLPTMLACDKKSSSSSETATGSSVSASTFTLNDKQRKVVSAVSEHIIPKTSTVGAIDVGVPAFIEMMLKDCYQPIEHSSFMEGIRNLEDKKFLTSDKAAQVAMLTAIDAETEKEMEARNVKQVKVGDNVDKEAMEAAQKGVPFWRLMKELTLLGYFTSEKGIQASFDYQPIPGEFKATKLTAGQKAYAYL